MTKHTNEMSRMLEEGCFVTGTDTDVGKTAIACGIVNRYVETGRQVAVMKPVASGCEVTPQGLRNADAQALIAASARSMDYALVNPFAYEPPIAPHLAAEQAGRPIRRDVIREAFSRLSDDADALIVEGVGGFRVPLGDFDTADLAVDVGLPVVLVVGLRLGCLNHALLTAEAVAERGLWLAGWVGNSIDPEMAFRDENIAALRRHLDAPCFGIVPTLPTVDASGVSRHLALPLNAI